MDGGAYTRTSQLLWRDVVRLKIKRTQLLNVAGHCRRSSTPNIMFFFFFHFFFITVPFYFCNSFYCAAAPFPREHIFCLEPSVRLSPLGWLVSGCRVKRTARLKPPTPLRGENDPISLAVRCDWSICVCVCFHLVSRYISSVTSFFVFSECVVFNCWNECNHGTPFVVSRVIQALEGFLP